MRWTIASTETEISYTGINYLACRDVTFGFALLKQEYTDMGSKCKASGHNSVTTAYLTNSSHSPPSWSQKSSSDWKMFKSVIRV